jgi:F-type H+-transporting ATPase subunit epsilon
MDSTPRTLQCVVVTPERAVLDEAVDSVVLPMYDGELGVLPGRAAMIGRLGFGELRVQHRGETRRFYIDSGFAEVRNNVVSVLTPRALRAEEIDPRSATQELETAPTPAAQQDHLKTQERARAQLRVVRRSKGETL